MGQNGIRIFGNVSAHKILCTMVTTVSTIRAIMGGYGTIQLGPVCAQITKYGIEMLVFLLLLLVTMGEYGMLVYMPVCVPEELSPASVSVMRYLFVQEGKSTIPSIICVSAHMACCSVILDVWNHNARMVSTGIHIDVQLSVAHQ